MKSMRPVKQKVMTLHLALHPNQLPQAVHPLQCCTRYAGGRCLLVFYRLMHSSQAGLPHLLPPDPTLRALVLAAGVLLISLARD